MTRIVIVGTGGIAHRHALAAQACGVPLTAAVNWRTESLEAFARQYGIRRMYTSIEDLLHDGDIDVAIICTPNVLHKPQSIALLEAGLHVLVEKPMATNVREAQLMMAAAERNNKTLMVAHCLRFDEEVVLLQNYVAAGQIGTVVRTKGVAIHTHWSPSGWFTQKSLAGGGALLDLGVHAIDTTRFLLGDPHPTSVYAQISSAYGDYDVDDTGQMLITWNNGITSFIECGWRQPHADGPVAATQLYATEGFAQLFPTQIMRRYHGCLTQIQPRFPARTEHATQEMYTRQLRHFLDNIAAAQPSKAHTINGLVVMRIVDAAYESARTGNVVRCD